MNLSSSEQRRNETSIIFYLNGVFFVLNHVFVQSELEREKKTALHETEERHRLECEQAQSLYQQEKESLSLQLQEKNNQILQVRRCALAS